MTKFADAFVEIKPDLSEFGALLSKRVAKELAAVGTPSLKAAVKIDVDRSELSRFAGSGTGALGREIASKIGPVKPKVEPEVDHNALRRLAQRLLGDLRVKLNVDVDRNVLGGALRGLAAGVGGLLGNLPVIGGLFQGLTSSFGTTALGAGVATAAILGLATVLAALVASLGAAAAGLGALSIALAGALGPALLVTVGAFARFAAIVKAVRDHQSNAGNEARGLAGAQAQLTAATDAVAQAQTNLKEQATAAYQAWATAIETVKDDLLSVQDAQLGIDESRLSLREAKQELADFRAKAGEAGDAFGAVFKKFTDVNVNTSGLRSALKAAGGGRGGLSEDQELKLERLILNVRRAKLDEKHATDALHDSTVKLAQDRKTEADFAQRGIKAYKPYTDATRQLASAQRSLASAQRAGAAATERQNKAWDDLSPAERKFGTFIVELGHTLGRVFTPVMAALLTGVTRGLQSFAKAATDPKVKAALVDTGRALGNSFARFAKVLTGPEMRRAFVRFAGEGAKIIPKLAEAFANLLVVLSRIGLAASGKKGLGGLIDGFLKWTGQADKGTRNAKSLRESIGGLVDTFKTWLGFLIATFNFMVRLGGVLAPIGTQIVAFLTHPIESLKQLAEQLGFTKRDAHAFGAVLKTTADIVIAIFKGIATQVRGVLQVVRGVMRVIAGVLTLNFREAWDGIKDIFRGGIRFIKGIFQAAIDPLRALGKRVGGAIVGGIKSAFHAVVGFFEDRINNLIDIANAAIRAYNKIPVAPNIGTLAHVGQRGVDDIVGKGTKFPKGPITPAGPRHGTDSHGHVIGRTSSLRVASRVAPRVALAAAASGGPAQVIEKVDVNVSSPAGALPDGRVVANQVALELDRLG